MMGNITNVVFINTIVVFVRLYWFEKRFQHVVTEAMRLRRTKSLAMTDERDKHEVDTEKGQRGVDGRSIVLLTDSGRVLRHGDGYDSPGGEEESSGSSSQGKQELFSKLPAEGSTPLHRNITFAENLVSPTRRTHPEDQSPADGLPGQHIERQRNQADQEVLRIPGPRESDRGKMPEIMNSGLMSPDGDPQDHHIIVDASNVATRYRGRTSTSSFQFRHSATQRSQGSFTALDRNASTRSKRLTGLSTISNVKSFFFARHDTNHSKTAIAPYLSWQPTVGRNSAFVDLTEEQREELGGIEYRSLKTLAFILIGKLNPFSITTLLIHNQHTL